MKRRPPVIEAPDRFGAAIYGPALFAFLVWLIRHPATTRLDRLYFASREGWLLAQLYRELRAKAAIPSMPPGLYLPCSRRALLAARLGATRMPDATLLTASSRWFEGSIDELLAARIGFTPRRPTWSGAASIALMRDAEIVHCVADLLAAEIAPQMRARHAAFRAYATSRGLRHPARIGLVDVGYSATIQSAIQRVLGLPITGFYMATTEAAGQVRAERGYAFGAFAQGEAAAAFGGEYGLLLEAVLTAPHGQVIGYKRPRLLGLIRPRPIHDTDAPRDFATLERIHAGILSYCLQRFAAHGLQPEADPLAMLRRLGQGAITVSPKIRAALRVDDAFCGNGEIDVLARLQQAFAA